MPWADKSAEQSLLVTAVVSKDRAVQVEEFQTMFLFEDELHADTLDSKSKALWHRLFVVVQMLRAHDGLTMNQLMEGGEMSASQIRQCIKVLTNLGGEIEARLAPYSDEHIFILHN